MKIWELNYDEKSRSLTYDFTKAKSENHPIRTYFDGSIKGDNWIPIHLISGDKGKYIDLLAFKSGLLAFNGNAYSKIAPFIKEEVEFLSATHDEFEVHLVNVTNVIDCVDKNRSISKRLPTETFIGYKEMYVNKELIPDSTHIFKIPELSISSIYVTDHFVELVNKNKLKGFVFTEILGTEFTEEMAQEKQQKYELMLANIEKNKGAEFSYDDAVDKVRLGLAAASGKWKMQQDSKGRFWLGQLTDDCEYSWIMPAYIPPILLGYQWHEIDKTLF